MPNDDLVEVFSPIWTVACNEDTKNGVPIARNTSPAQLFFFNIESSCMGEMYCLMSFAVLSVNVYGDQNNFPEGDTKNSKVPQHTIIFYEIKLSGYILFNSIS